MVVDEMGGLRLGHRLTSRDVPWRQRARVLIIWLAALLVSTALLVVPLPFSGQVTLTVGDVAPADIVAPRQATYVSAIQTQKLRDAAVAAVPDLYDPPQARIARQQVTLANQVLSFIGSVRGDIFADSVTKTQYLAAVKGLDLPAGTVDRILVMPAPAWDRAAAEVQVVLDRAMREEIREGDLATERRKVPARVRLDLPDEDAAIVSQIVQSLLVPNSFFNAPKTEERRQQARDRVSPATITVERSETILRAGDIVSAEDMEALNALGLRQATFSWQDLRSAGAVVFLLGMAFLYYLWRQEPEFWLNRSEPVLLSSILVLFILVAKVLVPAHAVLPYIFPYAALTMLLAVLLNLRIALVATGFFVLLVGWLATGSSELMTFAFCSSLVGALKLRRGEHLLRFVWAAIFVVYTGVCVVLAFRLAAGRLDLRGLTELSLAAILNGFATMTVAMLGSYIAGSVFGLATPLQLMEISRPTHPLLHQLLLKAPGTYHHTLVVSNMAERAAEAIGADAQLARVGAYFHDVGKTLRPYFFAENRSEDQDPHARLDPYTSAQIIINHVPDGIDLARKYHLPARVIDFIPEHHGTTQVVYFYHEAVKQAGSIAAVDSAPFTYPGPRPKSRETAITMLADCAEATVRAKHPTSAEEITRIVIDCIQTRIAGGQLNESTLTLGDLQAIQGAFVDVLRGMHHPRITYPSDVRAPMPATGESATNQPEVGNGHIAPPHDPAPHAV